MIRHHTKAGITDITGMTVTHTDVPDVYTLMERISAERHRNEAQREKAMDGINYRQSRETHTGG